MGNMENTAVIKLIKKEDSFEMSMDTKGSKFTIEDTAKIAIVLLPSLIVELLKDLPTRDNLDHEAAFEDSILTAISRIMGKFLKVKAEREEKNKKPQDKAGGLDCDCETEA